MSKIFCILDGFGLTKKSSNNAIALAKMPNFKYLLKKYPWISLNADGEYVGQEPGLVGNSEVGHINLGALKKVPQLSYQITKSSLKAFNLDKKNFPDQNFDPKDFLKKNLNQDQKKVVHLVGLFSVGTIHSDFRHWLGAIEASALSGADLIVMHIISDGRDSDRQNLTNSWKEFREKFKTNLEPIKSKICLGSLGGRFFLMDRDNNWHRTGQGLGALLWEVKNKKEELIFSDSELSKKYLYSDNRFDFYENKGLNVIPESIIYFDQIEKKLETYSKANYQSQIFDEYLTPITFYDDLKTNDIIWLINFRTDRMKQIIQALVEVNIEFNLNLNILAMNDYGVENLAPKIDLKELNPETKFYSAVFQPKPVSNTLSEKISKIGKSQLHLAETEKYNHVTYFFNGGQNLKSENEDWQVIPSWKVTSHSEKPEMKAKEITDYLLDCLKSQNEIFNKNEFYDKIEQIIHPGFLYNFNDFESFKLLDSLVKDGRKILVYINNSQLKNKIIEETEWGYEMAIYQKSKRIEHFLDSQVVLVDIDDLSTLSRIVNKIENDRLFLLMDTKLSEGRILEEIVDKHKKTIITSKFNYKYNLFDLFDTKIFFEKLPENHSKLDLISLDENKLYWENGKKVYDYIIVNYANPDMVGHTGDLQACINSMEVLDQQLGRLINVVENKNHQLIITADHGNAEVVGEMEKNGIKTTDTEHNSNPVPLIIVNPEKDFEEEFNNFINEVKSLKLNVDIQKMKDVFLENQSKKTDIDIDNWFFNEKIYNPEFPLFLAGVFLISMKNN